MDLTPFQQVLQAHPWLKEFETTLQPLCPDCKVKVGDKHEPGCDIARCSICGDQHMCCNCEDGQPDIWIGLMYPTECKLCLEKGFWCFTAILVDGDEYPITSPEMHHLAMRLRDEKGFKMRFHIPCGRDDPGASPDINRAMMFTQRDI